MELFSPTTIKNILEKYGSKPSKRLGQNFLVDQNILQKIIQTADIKDTDTIVEVGPGLGVLTQELAKHAKKVIAIEKDRQMIAILQETLKDYKNVEIIQADILQITSYQLPATNYKVVANIPYYLTSPLIRKFLEADHQPELLVLMVQKEVAQRMCAKPPEMSLLAVAVQYYATPKIAYIVSKNSFWPAPKVDSAIVTITPNETPAKNSVEFFAVVKAGFSQPRKQLANNLSKSLKIPRAETEAWLKKNNILPTQRAETLTVQDWANLTKTYEH